MAGRPRGVKSWVSTDGSDVLAVSGFEGALYGLTLSWQGQTIGDRVVLYDSLTGTGTKLWEFILPTAAGFIATNFSSVGKQFVKGVFVNPNIAAVTQDKFKLEFSYDGV